jgi:carbamoyl-phosphate synthase small subunit
VHKKANKNINCIICFADGEIFYGKGIGFKGDAIGEICFNTSITGYQEILTDPSYAGQIITFTFPHIGNIGYNDIDKESDFPKCKGLIVREHISEDSNYRSDGSLNDWLIKHKLTGIYNVDTRQITKKIKKDGGQNIIISYIDEGQEFDIKKLTSQIENLPNLKNTELASKVSRKYAENFNSNIYDISQNNYKISKSKDYKVVVIDYGVKDNILRELNNFGLEIVVVPSQSSFANVVKHKPDGVFLSNGPADPEATAVYATPVIQDILKNNIPIFGICMGHQLLSIAVGLKTIKMHQGHRGGNHPVKNLKTGAVEITSQNHGFCVEDINIPENIEVTHISIFDGTIEGIRLKDKPAFSVQYHPESSPGPNDSKYLFQEFVNLINESRE